MDTIQDTGKEEIELTTDEDTIMHWIERHVQIGGGPFVYHAMRLLIQYAGG